MTKGFKTQAIVHTLKDKDEVAILHEKGSNDVIAKYNGKRCTAVYNLFVGMFYVDDIYGVLSDQHKCPTCGEYVA